MSAVPGCTHPSHARSPRSVDLDQWIRGRHGPHLPHARSPQQCGASRTSGSPGLSAAGLRAVVALLAPLRREHDDTADRGGAHAGYAGDDIRRSADAIAHASAIMSVAEAFEYSTTATTVSRCPGAFVGRPGVRLRADVRGSWRKNCVARRGDAHPGGRRCLVVHRRCTPHDASVVGGPADHDAAGPRQVRATDRRGQSRSQPSSTDNARVARDWAVGDVR
jgi:hypothetical protein